MRLRLEVRVWQAALARCLLRLERSDPVADAANQRRMAVVPALSIELDQGLDRNAVHVHDKAISTGIVVRDVHREALQCGPVQNADYILVEVPLGRRQVPTAPVRIASIS